MSSDVSHNNYHIVHADCRKHLPALAQQVDLIVTSPPYADARQPHYDSVAPHDYPDWFMSFHEPLWQALKPEGSFILNMKDKVVRGVRHHYVWATIEKLIGLGWHCIDDYIWHKKTSMPGYWPTRLRDAWEYVFHLSKVKKPYINQDAVKVSMAISTQQRLTRLNASQSMKVISATGSRFQRNFTNWLHKKQVLPSNVLHLCPENRNQGHPAVFPVALPQFFIRLLSKPNDLVIDPFAGSGTTGLAALSLGRRCVLIDNQLSYCQIAEQRLSQLIKQKQKAGQFYV